MDRLAAIGMVSADQRIPPNFPAYMALTKPMCVVLSLEHSELGRMVIGPAHKVDIVSGPFLWDRPNAKYRRSLVRNRKRFIYGSLVLVLLVFLPAGSSAKSDKSEKEGGKVVYVCACLKNKSCSCMTEAKMQGPCACGTEGGPPMKAVPVDSDWAKENRDALGK